MILKSSIFLFAFIETMSSITISEITLYYNKYIICVRVVTHQVRGKATDIQIIAFRIHYGNYEYLVISFNVRSAPEVFIDLTNMLLAL